MTDSNNSRLNIFYFYKRPEGYALYNLEDHYFVIFLNGGHGNGVRTVQITQQSFDELMIDDHNFSQIIERDRKLKSLDKIFKEHSYTLAVEPCLLYNLDDRYFVEMWKKQRTGQSQATEISEEEFNYILEKSVNIIPRIK
ncbi:hypothetical protein KPY62_10295 [Psychrobacter sp. TAE2020]|uniref:hypothetical protein n=1 Tax=Psychrobacter sp. TAE2020 TaxID=2846762 RepID=UPI001C111D40|nr:hypothetical protein [Psychrobacter sp. TAE2020]MBU5617473.1 hypothetical protein [Psychrobacter sp. TAE2020]